MTDVLPLLSTGLAGILVGVGIACGSLVANMRALTTEVHALRDETRKRTDDHETRLRSMETEQTRQGLRLAALER